MNILLVHNEYQQRGGEDTVFEQEQQLLRHAGHRVTTYKRSNHELENYGVVKRLSMVKNTAWSEATRRDFARVLQLEKPDIVHLHNTFVMISPSIYWACYEANVPVVQTLHNYRLFCPSGDFLRQGKVCEECLEHSLLRSVQYGCYRGSRVQSAVLAATLAYHRRKGTWADRIDIYIALTEFGREKFIKAGLLADRVIVKPNFVHPDPGAKQGEGEYALFVGRISAEKGVRSLVSAWERLGNRIPLVIVGDGPLYQELRAQTRVRGLNSIVFTGRLAREATLDKMKRARFLVFPSEWYENSPMTILEAYACGLPVVASAIGALMEVVEENVTGMRFRVGDPADLAEKVDWAWSHADRMLEMGNLARRTYEAKYTGERNYSLLMSIYQRVLQNRVKKPPAVSLDISGHRNTDRLSA